MKKMLSLITAAVLSSFIAANSLLSASATDFTITVGNSEQNPVIIHNNDPQQNVQVNRFIRRDSSLGCTLKVRTDALGYDEITFYINLLNPDFEGTKTVVVCYYASSYTWECNSLDGGEESFSLSADNPGPILVHSLSSSEKMEKIDVVISQCIKKDAGGTTEEPDLSFEVTI
jgi:hypothetical protein